MSEERSGPPWTVVVSQSIACGGAAWCGAVLSQVFLHGEAPRLFAALAMSPAVASMILTHLGSTAPRNRRAQLWLTAGSLGVLLFCVALALLGYVELSDGGQWKRVVAVFSFAASLAELWRLTRRAQPPLPSPAFATPRVTPYRTTLSEGSFDEVLAERATALGTTRDALLVELERAIGVAAATHFGGPAKFAAQYSPARQSFQLEAVLPAPAGAGVEPGDELVFEVFWRLEERAQAVAQDEAYASRLGFRSVDSDFPAVVDRVIRETLGLPALGPLERLREDWLRLLNAGLFVLDDTKTAYVVELATTSDALPAPLARATIFDVALEGPKLNDFKTTPRRLDAEVVIDGRAMCVGTASWTALTVSVLGRPEREPLEAWAKKWTAPASEGDQTKLGGAVHKAELIEYRTGCELTLDLGSAPVAALEELVRLLRGAGEVSFDDAALRALAERRYAGTCDDVVPLVRAEGGSLGEHLVGDLWIHYAVESSRAFAGMTPEEASGLGLDLAGLRALAVRNLRKRLAPTHFTGHGGVYMLTLPGEGGYFEASLLLLDEVWAAVAPLVRGDVVAALPCRDLLFVTGALDAAGLEKVRGMADDARARGLEGQLSQQLLTRRDGAWCVFAGAAASSR